MITHHDPIIFQKESMTQDIVQAAILIFSAIAIWLVTRKEHWSRWGYIFGLMSQPFWLYVTWAEGQWGMFALSLWYTYSWLQGVWNYWLNASPES